MYPGQIMLDTIQGKMADSLLSRAPGIGPRVRQLIRGLMTVRHDKRWGYTEVTKFLAGENVEVFNETWELPPLELAGVTCASYKEIAQTLLNNPKAGKEFIFTGKLVYYVIRVDQQFAEKLLDTIDSFSAKNELDKGLINIAYTLCSNLPFVLGSDKTIASLGDLLALMESAPHAVLPFLKDESKGLYTYLEVMGLGNIVEKVREAVKSITSDIKLIPRILVALRGNSISPFQDGINNDLRLESLEQLYKLPDYLHERVLIFIEKKTGLLPAWIENMTGQNLDWWLCSQDYIKEQLKAWGKWNYFTLFLHGKARIKTEEFFVEKDGKKLYGLKDGLGTELIPAVWEEVRSYNATQGNFIVKKNEKSGVVKSDGTIVIPVQYEYVDLFDEERGLYMVRITKDEDQVINENGDVFYTGGYLSFVHAPQKPFDVIVDSAKPKVLLSKDFSVIKKAEKIDVFTHNDKNFVWMLNAGKVSICDSQGVVIREVPCDEFSVDSYLSGTVWITKNHISGIVQSDGTEIIKPVFDRFEPVISGTYFVKKYGKWGLVDARRGDTIIPCSFEVAGRGNHAALFGNGNHFTLYDNAGTQIVKIIQSAEQYTIKKLDDTASVTALYIAGITGEYDDGYCTVRGLFRDKLYIYDSSNFLSLSLETFKTEIRDIESREVEQLLKHITAQQLLQMINNLKEQNKIPEMNKLIEATWKHFYDKKDWETARKILWFIQADKTEKLERAFDYYEAMKANTCQFTKDYQTAVDCYEDAIERNPNECWYYWRCGDAYKELKNYTKALHHFEKSLEFEPKSQWLLDRKGIALLLLNRHKEAIACFTAAIEIENKPVFYIYRGHAYKALGMQDKADADYKTAKKYE
jgi:tetratricopeptide (TPR) repeat protein